MLCLDLFDVKSHSMEPRALPSMLRWQKISRLIGLRSVLWKQEFPDNDEVVVQTYLNDPMLINEKKWDMRTYILITSIHPLRIYMYRDGLVRFASTKYDKDAKDGGKKTAFLTNTSVNKKIG